MHDRTSWVSTCVGILPAIIDKNQEEWCCFFIGVEPAEVNGYPSLHSDKYDFTDAALGVAMRMFGEIVMNWGGGR